MLSYAMRLDELNRTLAEIPKLSMYEEFYGFTSKDLGLYALVDNKIAGAVWIRRLNVEHGSNGFIDENTPILSIAVLPEFRGQGIGSVMMEQLLVEAGALYEQISLAVVATSCARSFYVKHGFVHHNMDFSEKSFVDGSDMVTLVKKLAKSPVVRPSDGYDPRRWMD